MTTPDTTPQDGSPEGHAATMAAKFDQAQAAAGGDQPPANNAPERPSWLPEKFKSAEDMAAAYAELEKKNSAPKPDAGTPPADAAAAAAQVAAAGLDFSALTTEYQTSGALSDETYAALAAKGIDKGTVDSYIAGQEALAQQAIDGVLNEFGGADEYSKMVSWATTGLPANEVAAFNHAMDNGTVDSIKLTIAGLKARYEAANGKEPNLLGGGNGDSNTDVFRSTAEMTAAMRDPRYKADPAYRRDVQEKLGRSNIL